MLLFISIDTFSENKDLFYEKLSYDKINISKIEKNGLCFAGKEINSYKYDPNHRLTSVSNIVFAPEKITGRYNAGYSYDSAGNISSLSRNGYDINSKSYETIDRLVYTLEPSPLDPTDIIIKTITDVSGNTNGQLVNTGYDYDANGNLTKDTGKGIPSIKYALNNLPIQIALKGSPLLFDYTFSGEQYRKRSDLGTRVYFGGVEFLDGQSQFLSHEAGRYNFLTEKHEYFIADHLGNNVVVFTDDDEDGDIIDESIATDEMPNEVLQRNYYYSFGMIQEGWTNPEIIGDIPSVGINPENNYLYNGKELHEDVGLNWSNYGFRFYDPAIARFTTIDPLTEMFPHQSGYVYADNNPISKIDFMGLSGESTGMGMNEGDKNLQVDKLGIGETDGGALDEVTISASKIYKNGSISAYKDSGWDNLRNNIDPTLGSQMIYGTLNGAWSLLQQTFTPRGGTIYGLSPWDNYTKGSSEGLNNSMMNFAGIMSAPLTGGLRVPKPNQLPLQMHHYATNKHKFYTPQMSKIAQRFGLDLDGAWNKELLPHLGRHPHVYHDFVLSGMQRSAAEAGTDATAFKALYNKYVKETIRNNPQLLRKSGWE